MERRRSRDRRRPLRIARTSLKSRAPRRTAASTIVPVVRSRRAVAARDVPAREPRTTRLRDRARERDGRDGGRKAYKSEAQPSVEKRDHARPSGRPVLRAAERPTSVRSVIRPNEGTRIYIENFAANTSRSDLQRYFEKTALSGIVQVKMKDQYAVAEFSSHKDAEKALQTNGRVYMGWELHVCATIQELHVQNNAVENGVHFGGDGDTPERNEEQGGQGRSDDGSLAGEIEDDEEGYDEPDLLDNTPGNQGEEGEISHRSREAVSHRSREAERRRSRSRSRGRLRAEEGEECRSTQKRKAHGKLLRTEDEGAELKIMDEKVIHLELLLHERDCEIRRLKASLDRFEGQVPRGEDPDRDSRRNIAPEQTITRPDHCKNREARGRSRDPGERSRDRRERTARCHRSLRPQSPRGKHRETRTDPRGDTRAGDPRGDPRAGEARAGDARGDARAGDAREARAADPRGDTRTGDPRRETYAGDPRREAHANDPHREGRERRSATRGETRRSPRRSSRRLDDLGLRRSERKRKHAERVQDFIVKNGLDDGCSRLLESLTEAQQLAVINEGFIIDDLRTRGPGKRGNRSAIVVGRINRVTRHKERSRRR